MQNIFIQGIGFFGTVMFFLSFQCKSNKNLFRVQFVSYFCYTLHLALLGATTGAVSYMFNTLRSICLGSKSDFLKSKKMCAIICLMQLLTLAFTWSGWISLLPVIANIAATVGGYTYHPRKIRMVAMFVNSPLWIVYDIIIGSYAGILDEAVTEVSIVISIIRYGWKNLDKPESNEKPPQKG